MLVRNKRTGIVTDYPEKQAKWLESTGRCEIVKAKTKVEAMASDKAEAKVKPEKKTEGKAAAANKSKAKVKPEKSNNVAVPKK